MTFRTNFPALVVALASVAALTSIACHPQEPTSPAGGVEAPYDPPKLEDVKPGRETEVAVYSMYYGPTVQHFCAGPDPYFKFDSSTADSSDVPTLKVLADCMTTGPLKNRMIVLTGRTDPRGSDQYNAKLGQERADRVKRYLVAHGVDASRIQTGSAGESEASQDPKEWPKDRRVEIELANP